MNFIRAYNNKKLTKNIINNLTCHYYNDIYFFKWDNPRYFKLLKRMIVILNGKDMTQRICVIDKNNIKSYDNTLKEDVCRNIPMPLMDCEFNDKETIRLLNQIRNGGNENGI